MSEKIRHLAVVRIDDSGAPSVLGTKREVLSALGKLNTAPDGSSDGQGVLYGPGFRVELPFVGDDDPVKQALITVQEDDIAWPVLARICDRTGWRMMDPESGRTFGA